MTNEPKFIPVTQATIGKVEVHAVEARDLHAGLGVRKAFTDWIKQQIDRLRLVSDRDYRLEVPSDVGVSPRQGTQSTSNGRPATVYWLTLDSAKHIAMMANTERGFAVREYFIECERLAHGPAASSPIKQKPWLERSIAERDIALKTANTLGRLGNHATAWWYIAEVVQVADFPKRILPTWHQNELDIREREKREKDDAPGRIH